MSSTKRKVGVSLVLTQIKSQNSSGSASFTPNKIGGFNERPIKRNFKL